MTVKEVLTLATAFLNLQTEFEGLINGVGSADARTQKEFDNLQLALNLCYQDIAQNYLPLLYTQELTIENNKIYLSDITKELCQVYSITSIDGKKGYKFKVFDNYIDTNVNGLVKITYSYVPVKLNLNDTINNFAGRISKKCLAMGTVSEYCYISGLYEDAALWGERYKDDLKTETRKRGEIVLPKRRWF